jgi:hypothetical protein
MRFSRLLLVVASLAGIAGDAHARALAVAWNDDESGRGGLAAMRVVPPWDFVTPVIEIGLDAVLHARDDAIYALSPRDGSITAVDIRSWTVLRTYELGAGSEPQDIAVVPGRKAYVSRAGATRLLRLDLDTGAATEVVDLAPFADADGLPDLARIAVHRGRLFVQLRRIDSEDPLAARPALAVVDIATERVVDADPGTPGVQAIALEGTAPRFRMQIFWRTRELLLSSTGGFFDQGGIEVIDLPDLESKGLLIAEADGNVGADLGAFVRVDRDRGFLTYSTDLLLSSHLHEFTFAGDVGPELHVALDYFTPALVHDRPTDVLFAPDGNFGSTGVRAFEADGGRELTTVATPTSGPPSDLLLLRRTPRPR